MGPHGPQGSYGIIEMIFRSAKADLFRLPILFSNSFTWFVCILVIYVMTCKIIKVIGYSSSHLIYTFSLSSCHWTWRHDDLSLLMFSFWNLREGSHSLSCSYIYIYLLCSHFIHSFIQLLFSWSLVVFQLLLTYCFSFTIEWCYATISE